jgi:hypothetical protein
LINTGNQLYGLLASIMAQDHPALRNRTLLALLASVALATPATAQNGRVIFVGPVETVSSTSLPFMIAHKMEALASIDPKAPVARDRNAQTLSLFGREDLIAGVSDDYKVALCTPLDSAPDPFGEIERRARQTSVVIINESHERSDHRGFIAEVAKRLRPLGYDTLAIETLNHDPPETPLRYRPTFEQEPNLPYLVDSDGFYLSEAAFGRLGREAKALGYALLAYENIDNPPPGVTRTQQIATREEGQAVNLAAYVRSHPKAKLLIHVGYSHAAETPRSDGQQWMATRLKAKTGIDPLTISQTTCRGSSGTTHLSALPKDQPPGTFDLIVDHPIPHFERGRPTWRRLAGDVAVSIPEALRPTAGWRVVEARPDGEPATSVPMDRVAIRPDEDVALMLPPGRYNLRIVEPSALPPPSTKAAH